jgi:soluble lytic murein transglycosylase-like protein
VTNLREAARAALAALALTVLSAPISDADQAAGARGEARRDRLYQFTDQQGVLSLSNLPHLDKRYQLAYPGKPEPMIVPAPRNPRREDIARFTPLIEAAARKNQVDPFLLHAVIRAESGYNPNALSVKGASGLMQLMPATARRYGVKDIFDPRENIEGGTRYLKDLLELFQNNLELALAGYNAGEGSVLRAGSRIPNYRETLAYVPKVLEFYRSARSAER